MWRALWTILVVHQTGGFADGEKQGVDALINSSHEQAVDAVAHADGAPPIRIPPRTFALVDAEGLRDKPRVWYISCLVTEG